MANYEAQIKTRFGQLIIHFDNPTELVGRLKALDVTAINQAVEDHLSEVIIREPRQIKPVLAEICAFTPDGNLEFFKLPKEKLEVIGIVLYAFDPDLVDTGTVSKLAAAKAAEYVSKKQYQKYFEKIGHGRYRLTHEGKLWVINEIIPGLTAKPEGEE